MITRVDISLIGMWPIDADHQMYDSLCEMLPASRINFTRTMGMQGEAPRSVKVHLQEDGCDFRVEGQNLDEVKKALQDVYLLVEDAIKKSHRKEIQ